MKSHEIRRYNLDHSGGSSLQKPQEGRSTLPKRGEILKIQKIMKNPILAQYGSWEGLAGCKILLQGLGTIPTPGKPNSENFIF